MSQNEIILKMKCFYSQSWETSQRVNLRMIKSDHICDQTKFELELTDLNQMDMIKVGDIFEVHLTKQL